MAEEQRQFALHAACVVCIKIEDLLTGGCVESPVAFDVLVETRQVLESHLVRKGKHFGFDFVDLLQTEFVYMFGRHLGGSDAADGKAIARRSVGKRPDSRVHAAARQILVANEGGKMLIGGQDLAGNGREHSLPQPLLFGRGHARRELFYRLGKWTILPGLVCHVLCFGRNLLKKVAGRHQSVAHALPHVCRHLVERMRDLVQT